MQHEFTTSGGKLWVSPISDVCVNCLQRLVSLTVSEATQDESLRKKAIEAAHSIIEELRSAPSITPAQIANRFHQVIKRICHNDDPFRLKKIREMATARNLVENHPPLNKSLEELMVYSLKGNSIDFFRNVDELETLVQRIPEIAINDLPEIARTLESAKADRIIILADNAGEVYFDMPFMKALVSRGMEVYYAVKSAPVQNDLSMDDLIREGLLKELADAGVRVISTGVDSVGLDYERTSPEFKEIYAQADIVIAKGMGHLETLGKASDNRLVFMFEAKCPTIAHTLGLKIGDFVVCRGSSLLSRATGT